MPFRACFIFLLIDTLLAYNLTHKEPHKSRVRRIVGGHLAKLPPYDDPLVFVNFAGRFATIKGVLDFPHYVFRGLRFAHPPVKKERFQRPKQFILEGEINATKFPPACVQSVPGQDKIVGSEDCLFLNVFTPELPTGTEGLPVVVWIHGGGFRYGSASQYGVRHLVGKRVIVVTIQYRLGSLGFLTTGSAELPGNVGLWDMVMAVRWIRNYIGFFGGNPYNIVVMGHGTGASSAMLIGLNKVAKGFTNGIIALSGTAMSNWATDDDPQGVVKQLADSQGCPTTSFLTMVKCLQIVSAENIIKADSEIETTRIHSRGFMGAISRPLGASPVVEGVHNGRSLPCVVENEPLNQLSSGNCPNVPLFTGVTKEETERAVNTIYKNEITNILQSVPQFLNNILIRDLQSFTVIGKNVSGSIKNFWQQLDPLQFGKYVTTGKNNFGEGFQKISEATGDALFNLPAFLSVDLWSKSGAPAFLYSFEHNSKAKKAHHFLQGLPFVGNASNQDDSISHGDDLAFLFDAHSLEGKPVDLNEDFTEEDVKVREIYTQAIANFARHKKIMINNCDLLSFSNSNNYFRITSTPNIESNFRFCQMGLWAGLGERLQNAQCKLLKVLDSELENYQKQVFDIVSTPEKNIKNIGGLTGQIQKSTGGLTKNLPFGGIFGK